MERKDVFAALKAATNGAALFLMGCRRPILARRKISVEQTFKTAISVVQFNCLSGGRAGCVLPCTAHGRDAVRLYVNIKRTNRWANSKQGLTGRHNAPLTVQSFKSSIPHERELGKRNRK